MMSHENMMSAKGVVISSRSYESLRKEIIKTRKEFAAIPNSFEFDNKIRLFPGIVSKIRPRWQWKASLKRAIAVVISNGISAFDQDMLVSYKRNKTAYSDKHSKVNTFYLMKSLDLLSELGYVDNVKADSDLPPSKRKLSVYSLTQKGYDTFTTVGMRV